MAIAKPSQRLHSVAVTGINGFVGAHVARRLHQNGVSVVGIAKEPEPRGEVQGSLWDYVSADLVACWPAIPNVDAIVHLAGLSAVGPSFESPQEYIGSNSSMVTNMCESLVRSASSARVLIASSGAVYDSEQAMPIGELGAVAASSPYVVSKLLVETQARYYIARGMDVVIARPFNHIGPGQGTGFLLPDLFDGVKRATQRGERLAVGDLTTSRDYTDVRDVARAYHLLLECAVGTHRVFNVCSGQPVAGEVVLAELLAELGISDLRTSVDRDRFRPTDPRSVAGDSTLLASMTGWKPEHTLRSSVQDFVSAARRISAGGV